MINFNLFEKLNLLAEKVSLLSLIIIHSMSSLRLYLIIEKYRFLMDF